MEENGKFFVIKYKINNFDKLRDQKNFQMLKKK